MTTKTFRAAGLALGLLASAPGLAAEKVPQPNLPQEQKGDPAPDTKAAEDLLARGRYEDAIRQAKLALGRDERYVPAMIVMAKAYYHLRKFELTGSIIEIAKSIDSGAKKGENDAECYNLLGFLALNREDRIGATAGFKKATESDDKFGPGWLNLTAQYLYAKNYDGAVEAGERSIKLMKKSGRAHLNLGSAYRGKMRYADAEKEYKAALDLDANLADAWFDLGILYLDAKEMPGPKGPIDLTERLNTAISHFNRYKQLSGYKIAKDDPVDTYINDCKTQIDREVKRIERLKRQQERTKPKDGAAAPAPATPAPAPAAPGKK